MSRKHQAEDHVLDRIYRIESRLSAIGSALRAMGSSPGFGEDVTVLVTFGEMLEELSDDAGEVRFQLDGEDSIPGSGETQTPASTRPRIVKERT